MHIGLLVEYLLFLLDFSETSVFFPTDFFEKYPNV